MKQIAPNVYYSGILNPNMRVFDVIMRTEYGTSYNSYVVKGSEKTAVIDCSHKSFTGSFCDNIESIVGSEKIDYLIVNHTEPDHSGAIAEFAEKYPDIELYCSPAAAIYLKNITNNPDIKINKVKDGESISLGDKTLKFVIAPFLHWPDSMFTWLLEDSIVFSCDFLGAHYCEPQLYDYKITYPDKYQSALEYYYACIFSPFPKYVEAGLSKIKELAPDIVCPSHGPILTRDCCLPKAMEYYSRQCAPAVREQMQVPVFYCTAYGNTEMLAGSIKEGILSVLPDANVPLFNIIENDLGMQQELLNKSDGFLIGALTINKDAVPPIWNLLSGIDAVNIAKRPAALFGSFGWSGEAFTNIAHRLEDLKINLYDQQYKINFVPSEKQLADAVEFGKGFAETLKR